MQRTSRGRKTTGSSCRSSSRNARFPLSLRTWTHWFLMRMMSHLSLSSKSTHSSLRDSCFHPLRSMKRNRRQRVTCLKIRKWSDYQGMNLTSWRRMTTWTTPRKMVTPPLPFIITASILNQSSTKSPHKSLAIKGPPKVINEKLEIDQYQGVKVLDFTVRPLN